MGHSAHGKRSCRAQLLPPPAFQEGSHPSLPKGLLGYARREKTKLLIPAFNECGSAVSLWLQSHARNSVFYFSNGLWLSYTLAISAVTTAFSSPQFRSCTKTSRVIQHLVSMCSYFPCLEEICKLSRDHVSSSGTSASHQRKSSWISYESQPDDWHLTFFACTDCASVGARVTKEIIQDKLKCMYVLKWCEREETAVLSWP